MPTGIVSCDKCERARSIIQTWLDKQGHERCWYYPDLFRELADLFEVRPLADPSLPPRAEFEEGCRRFQFQEYDYGNVE